VYGTGKTVRNRKRKKKEKREKSFGKRSTVKKAAKGHYNV
jgi:hypothetical protein